MAFLIKSISFSSIKVDLKHFFFQSKLHSKQPISILKTFRFSKFVLFSSSELFVPNIHILSSPKPVVCLFSKATDNYSSPYQPASPHLTTTQRLVSHLFSTSWHLFFLQPTSASSSLRESHLSCPTQVGADIDTGSGGLHLSFLDKNYIQATKHMPMISNLKWK